MEQKFMNLAISQAKKALKNGDVPVGAVIVKDGKVLSRAYNTKESKQNVTHHAELLAISKACKKLKNFRLNDADLYVTLEPCLMCMGAILGARIKRLYIGCEDYQYGYAISNKIQGTYNLEIQTGILFDKCKDLLDQFFLDIRQKKQVKKLLEKQVNFIQGKYFVEDRELANKVINLSKNSNQPLFVIAIIEELSTNTVQIVINDSFLKADKIFEILGNNFSKKTIKIFTKLDKCNIYNV